MTELPTWGTLAIWYAGVFGLLIGSFLNVVVYRVPAGSSLMPSSRCPKCDAPIRAWQNVPVISWLVLRGRCASCGARISARYPLVEAGTGFAFAGITWWWLGEWSGLGAAAWGTLLTAYLMLAAVSIALALIDLDTFRLPNVIVLPATGAFLLLLIASTLLGASYGALLRALIGGAALCAFYLLLRVLWRGGMGLGDVKLAVLLGAAMAWIGWGPLLVGAFGAFVCGGVFGIALMLRGSAGRKTRVPFGPWMILGAWIGIMLGEPIATWYLASFFG